MVNCILTSGCGGAELTSLIQDDVQGKEGQLLPLHADVSTLVQECSWAGLVNAKPAEGMGLV